VFNSLKSTRSIDDLSLKAQQQPLVINRLCTQSAQSGFSRSHYFYFNGYVELIEQA